MSEFLRRAKEIAKTMAERAEKALNPPLEADAKPIDLRQFIVEAVEGRVQPIGQGRRALPDSLVKARVIAKDPATQRAIHAALSDIESVVMKRLLEVRCEVPEGFRIEVAYIRRRPASWPTSQPIAVTFETQPPARVEEAISKSVQPALVLAIQQGKATAKTYTLRQPVVRVGRSETLVDDRGRSRHNHVAFSEDGDAHSRTVGRGHCEIRYDARNREYRVFDERSANGTRVLRGGELIDVPSTDPLGVALKHGDELQFGTASARVSITETS